VANVSTKTELPRWVAPGLLALIGTGAAFYFWLVFTRWAHAEKWGDFGDAVGPFVALLNAGALFAALYSVRLQRQELALQRKELAANRKVMEEQAEQFERTAKAQEALAASQERLARAQEVNNEVILDTRILQLANQRENVARVAQELADRVEQQEGQLLFADASERLAADKAQLFEHQRIRELIDAEIEMLRQVQRKAAAGLSANRKDGEGDD
jgi:hypothetical protein